MQPSTLPEPEVRGAEPAALQRQPAVCRLPAALLLAVAVCHFLLVDREHLDPWLGGGFGMFSSVDGRPNRHIHVFVRNGGVKREIEVPEDDRETAKRARALPSRSRLGQAAHLAIFAAGLEPEEIDGLRVQVCAMEYGVNGLEPSARVLRDVALSVDSTGAEARATRW